MEQKTVSSEVRKVYADKMREVINSKGMPFGNYLFPPSFEAGIEIEYEPQIMADVVTIRVDFHNIYMAAFVPESEVMVFMDHKDVYASEWTNLYTID